MRNLKLTARSKKVRDLYRGINDFKKGYQPRCNTVTDEKGDLVAYSHSIVARWRNYFSQFFNVHGVKDVRQVEIPTADTRVPEPRAFEVELVIDKQKVINRQVLMKYRQN